MTQQVINLGTGPDTQTGDTVYVAFNKVNENFTELYSVLGNTGADLHGNTITGNAFVTTGNIRTGNLFAYGNIVTVGNLVASSFTYANGESIFGNINFGNVSSDILPSSGNTYSIGSDTNSFFDGYFGNSVIINDISLYRQNNSLYIGANTIVDGLFTSTGNVVADYFIGNFVGNISGNITAAGSNTQIMYNDEGSVDGDAALTFDKNTKTLYASNLTIGANTVIEGASLQVHSTDSVLLPVGDNTSRPGTAVPGMIRFNTVLGDIEYFDGSIWASPVTAFTLTVANAQVASGSSISFDLPIANASTAGTVVSINGIVQQPLTAYSITGNTVTFTEAPLEGDVIDFRIFTTTASITELSDYYGTTGLYLDEPTVGSKIITFKNNNTDTLNIQANGQVRVLSNIQTSSFTTGAMVLSGGMGVTGNVFINGTMYAVAKSFLIDHPLKPGKKLQYGSLEGPENGVYVRGRLQKDTTIELPDYWKELVDESTITVDLTPFQWYQELYVNKIDNNQIHVSNKTQAPINCFYTVWAERKDIAKLEVEHY
jgi:hypothetical protein